MVEEPRHAESSLSVHVSATLADVKRARQSQVLLLGDSRHTLHEEGDSSLSWGHLAWGYNGTGE